MRSNVGRATRGGPLRRGLWDPARRGKELQPLLPNVLAGNLTLDIDATLAEVCRKVPAMGDAARAFASLARERQNLEFDSAEWPSAEIFDAAAFGKGVPLLAGLDLSGLQESFLEAADRLLPVVERAFPHIGPDAAAVREAFAAQPGLGRRCMEAFLAGDAQGIEAAAKDTSLVPAALSFLVMEILKPCLRRAAGRLAHLADDDLWCKGYCPVCGAGPDLGFLKEKTDTSEFLISKAGRLWLHCSLCGHVWRFVRLVCPSCGQQDHERLEVLTAKGRERERIHACRDCRRYVLVIDLVESREKLHPDLAPLGLVHLDILAQKKGYMPISPTPWNRLS